MPGVAGFERLNEESRSAFGVNELSGRIVGPGNSVALDFRTLMLIEDAAVRFVGPRVIPTVVIRYT